MALVVNDEPTKVGAHALVVGVGEYPFLTDGEREDDFAQHDGLGQLSSPPQSARAFAQWLEHEYNNDEAPLRSLELLVSEPGAPADQRATTQAVIDAVKQWHARADHHAENVLLLYFCGHGISRGPVTSLLLEDFGADAANPLNNAIDFSQLWLGLDKCKARTQCAFVDACRVASASSLNTVAFSGHPVIYPSPHMQLQPRHWPAYHAAVPGSRAYGKVGQPSFFTQALLKALRGAGGDDLEGDWRIQSDVLNRGIEHALKRLVSDVADVDQLSEVDHLTSFTLCRLDGLPVVPVVVHCEPEHAHAAALLSCSGNGNDRERPAPDATFWDVDLEVGNYEFRAQFDAATGFAEATTSAIVRPPARRVKIPVT